MLRDTNLKKKIDLPEELLCAYVDGTTTPNEDREMLAMLASDKRLAQLHNDLKVVMDIINMSDEEMAPMGASCMPAFELSADDGEGCACELPPMPSAAPAPDYQALECMPSNMSMACEEPTAYEKSKAREEMKAHQEMKDRKESIRKLSFKKSCNSRAPEREPHSRITPFMIEHLAPNEIFVFGSNPWGLHNGGASKLAKRRFGAVQGQGEGRQGQAYAIPTIVGGVENIRPHVNRFIEYAAQHPELHFLVTRVGCGTAGFNPEDIAPLFAKAKDMANISLPHDFWRFIK